MQCKWISSVYKSKRRTKLNYFNMFSLHSGCEWTIFFRMLTINFHYTIELFRSVAHLNVRSILCPWWLMTSGNIRFKINDKSWWNSLKTFNYCNFFDLSWSSHFTISLFGAYLRCRLTYSYSIPKPSETLLFFVNLWLCFALEFLRSHSVV